MNRVLVVDDDELVRRAIGRCLSLAGYEVVCCCDGQEALGVARNERFDAVLSDVQMPVMGGLELVARLALCAPGLPVVLTSGVHDESIRLEALRRGAVDFLPKPSSFEEVLRVVASAVRRALQARADVLPEEVSVKRGGREVGSRPGT